MARTAAAAIDSKSARSHAMGMHRGLACAQAASSGVDRSRKSDDGGAVGRECIHGCQPQTGVASRDHDAFAGKINAREDLIRRGSACPNCTDLVMD